MARLFHLFQEKLKEHLKNGTQLPTGISQEAYKQVVAENANMKSVYTMPMHLWLFKTVPASEIAEHLQKMQSKGFKNSEKGIEIVLGWEAAAMKAVQERNPNWLSTMREPDQEDMRSACENFMPKWIKAFSLMIKKGGAAGGTGKQQQQPRVPQAILQARSRWQDEPIVVSHGQGPSALDDDALTGA
jgi:hypothetical protein